MEKARKKKLNIQNLVQKWKIILMKPNITMKKVPRFLDVLSVSVTPNRDIKLLETWYWISYFILMSTRRPGNFWINSTNGRTRWEGMRSLTSKETIFFVIRWTKTKRMITKNNAQWMETGFCERTFMSKPIPSLRSLRSFL